MQLQRRQIAHFYPFLTDEETIQWVGQPNPWRLFCVYDLVDIPFIIIWAVVVYSWVLPRILLILSTGNIGNFLDFIFYLVICLVGIYGLVGHKIVLYCQRRSTYYVVTDRRVLIVTGVFRKNAYSQEIHNLPVLTLQANMWGMGNLWLGKMPKHNFFTQLFLRQHNAFTSSYTDNQSTVMGFLDIREARQVYSLLEELRAVTPPATPPAPTIPPASAVWGTPPPITPAPPAAILGSPPPITSAPTRATDWHTPLPVTPAGPTIPTGDMVADAIQPYLEVGEHLRWAGQPNPWKLFNISDLFILPFFAFWGGMPTFFAIQMISRGEWIPAIFILPFFLIGSFMLFGRFIWNYHRRKRTFYAVTDRAVLVLRTLFGYKIERQSLSSLPMVEEALHADGSGTVRFGTLPQGAEIYEGSGLEFLMKYRRTGFFTTEPFIFPLAFLDIPEAHRVAELVHEGRRQVGGRE